MGWLSITATRWLWAAFLILSLVWMIFLCIRESGADTLLLRCFVGLIPLSMYATGTAIGNAQTILPILPIMVTVLLLLKSSKPNLSNDFLIAFLVIIALVKPNVTAPFFWLVLFIGQTLRPAILIILGYLALSFFAVLFQQGDLISLTFEWINSGKACVEWALSHNGGINVYGWAEAYNLGDFNLQFSLIILGILGFWVYNYRRIDIWTLMGVTALVSRFWTYHMRYDDLLLLLPMIALFRITIKQVPSHGTSNMLTGALLAMTLLTLLAPGAWHILPKSWYNIYIFPKTFIWIAVLIFLVDYAKRDRKNIYFSQQMIPSQNADQPTLR
jgi:hypothetical protein